MNMRKYFPVIIKILLYISFGFIATTESKTLFPTGGISKPIILRQANPYKIDLNMIRADYQKSQYALAVDINQDTTNFLESRTPLAAFIIGFAPGFFIHGLGYSYIGRRTAGAWLLLSEGVSILFVSVAIARSVRSENSSVGKNRRTDLIGNTGLILFFGGWIVDFIGAPVQLALDQAKMAGAKSLSIDIKDRNVILKYSVAF